MSGRYKNSSMGIGGSGVQEDSTKFIGLDESLSLLSKNVASSLNNPPNFNVVKNRDPIYSLSKSERFPKHKNNESQDEKILLLKEKIEYEKLAMSMIQNQVNFDKDHVY
jgi:cell fate regulator YaaT (PSP1 superfamily)